MVDLAGISSTLYLVDAENKKLSSRAEITLLCTEPGFNVTSGGQIARSSEVTPVRFTVNADGLKNLVDDLIKIHRLLADRDESEAAIVVPMPIEKESA